MFVQYNAPADYDSPDASDERTFRLVMLGIYALLFAALAVFTIAP